MGASGWPMTAAVLLAGALLAQAGCVQDGPSKPSASAPAARPNIVLILADDLGYADLSSQGSDAILTPNIDRIAREGVRMTDFYSAHPSCAPSRVGLLTGRYQHRFGFEHNPGAAQRSDPAFGVPAETAMISERLKTAGYVTAAVGKWHIGYQPDTIPTGKGFDTFYGTLEGAMAYTADAPNGLKGLMRGAVPAPMPAHVTEAFAREAADVITANRDRPFFIYAAFTAPHAPMQSTQAYLSRFADEADPRRRAYLAMMAALDEGVGTILDSLEANGLTERTLVIFASDNGAPTWQTTGSNAPFNGVKGLVLEGGIRTPALFRWPGHFPAGRLVAEPGSGHDIAATVLAAAGLRAELDGRDLGPVLSGAAADLEDRPLFWRSGAQGAVRYGDLKAVRAGDQWMLFDLARDPAERTDLAARRSSDLSRLRGLFEDWERQMSPPRWEWSLREMAPGERDAGIIGLIRDYVAGRETDPRPVLYGGGPE